MIRKVLALTAVFALVGCQTPLPISNNPVQTVAGAAATTQLGGTIITGLQDSAFNLDSAISIGVLQAGDNVDACVHSTLQTLGADVTLTGPVVNPSPPKTFQPKVSDLLSAGSVAYILSVQAKALSANAGSLIPMSCKAIVGDLVIKSVNAPATALIKGGIGLLP